MPLSWFNVREAVAVGAALADQLAAQTKPKTAARAKTVPQSSALQDLLRHADREVRTLQLNFYKRAKLANSFKWRLLEKGVEKEAADEFTQSLIMHLMTISGATTSDLAVTVSNKTVAADSGNAKQLLSRGHDLFSRRDYAGALAAFETLVALKPRHADALNNLGAALCKLSRFREAETYFWQAIKIRPDYPEAFCNLGLVQQWKGLFPESEASLRRALKLKSVDVEARSLLGVTLAFQGRLTNAKAHFEKALKIAPKHIQALLGMGQIAAMAGQFGEAETWLKRALEVNPEAPSAWAGLAGLRRMTSSDAAWLERAQKIAANDISPTEEAALRFAIGKYRDDIQDFGRAFHSYRQANELAKGLAEDYQRDAHTRFVDDLIRAYSRDALAACKQDGSDSTRPLFVVGMLRSGTTLAEQIIGSHSAAKGAGELGFWSNAGRKHEAEIRQGLLDAATREKLAEEYLRVLAARSADARYVVDKAPINSDYLGVIHSVFPNARIIYMRRDPIDTCLSCYFQQFTHAFRHTHDLSDLAHYYRQHHRLMAHWRAVLPPDSILEVRYEDLIADQAAATRRILDFIGLEWDQQCLDFYKTEGVVATASSWQVRQKLYNTSVERWRKYEKFIGPLMGLRKLDA